jgi:hypothetical protein
VIICRVSAINDLETGLLSDIEVATVSGGLECYQDVYREQNVNDAYVISAEIMSCIQESSDRNLSCLRSD